jgi:hypothetical protein
LPIFRQFRWRLGEGCNLAVAQSAAGCAVHNHARLGHKLGDPHAPFLRHRLEEDAPRRAHPMRDIVLLTLLLGGLAVTITGFYLAIRRIRNDVTPLFRFFVDWRRVAIKKADSVEA